MLKTAGPEKDSGKTVEACMKSMETMHRTMVEKEAKMQHMESLLQTLQFYNCFSKQQSHFVEYVQEIQKLERENERLVGRVRQLQQELKTCSKKPGTGVVLPTDNGKKEDERRPGEATSVGKMQRYLRDLVQASTGLKDLIDSSDLLETLRSFNGQIVPEEVRKEFPHAEKTEEGKAEKEAESSSSSGDSDSEIKEPKFRQKARRMMRKTKRSLDAGLRVFLEYLDAVQPPQTKT